jgi:hypothetical protein
MSDTISLEFIGQSLKRLNESVQKLSWQSQIIQERLEREFATHGKFDALHTVWLRETLELESRLTARLDGLEAGQGRLEAGQARIEAALAGLKG